MRHSRHPSVLCSTCTNAIRRLGEGKPRTPCRAGMVPGANMFSCDSYVRRFPYVVRRGEPNRTGA